MEHIVLLVGFTLQNWCKEEGVIMNDDVVILSLRYESDVKR